MAWDSNVLTDSILCFLHSSTWRACIQHSAQRLHGARHDGACSLHSQAGFGHDRIVALGLGDLVSVAHNKRHALYCE